MNIAIIGYGKMGKEIEKIALERNHTIALVIDQDNLNDFNAVNFEKIDVAIDFSTPESGYSNIIKCFEYNTPIVSGTTGWLDKYDAVKKKCTEENQTFFYAPNYSIGVNIFFKINDVLSKIMNNYTQYEVCLEEIHHIQKLDAPSGTAISLANNIIKNIERKTKWGEQNNPEEINIKAIRKDAIPGIHTVIYDSDIDTLTINHSAKSRKGFAFGAVLAAEFIKGKKGIYNMNDLLNL